jgi:hypothetical protein
VRTKKRERNARQERLADEVVGWPEAITFWFVIFAFAAAPVGLSMFFWCPQT